MPLTGTSQKAIVNIKSPDLLYRQPTMATVELCNELGTENGVATAYLIVDTESIPDGRLLSLIKYPDEDLSEDEAIARIRPMRGPSR